MRASLPSVAVTLALGVALLGCGGDDEDRAEPAAVRTATTKQDPASAAAKPAKKPPEKPAKKAAKKHPPAPATAEPQGHGDPVQPPAAAPPPISSGTSEDIKEAEREARKGAPILGGAPPSR